MDGQDTMNNVKTEQPPPLERAGGSNGGDGRDQLTEKLVEKLLQTKEFKEMTGALMPEVLRVWAGDSSFRRMVARLVGKTMESSLLSPEQGDGKTPTMWEDLELTALLLEKLPALVNHGIKGTGGISKVLDSLSDEKKQTVMGEALKAIDSASLGEAVSTFIRIINEIHENNPTFVSDQMQEPIQRLVENLDFADVEDIVKHSQNDLVGLVRAVNVVFDRYPAKVVCLLGIVPATINVITAISNEASSQLDNMPPDLLTEVILSLMEDIDGKAIGEAINYQNELLRKIHTGSALLGPAGHPQFTQELTRKLKEIVSVIDTEVWWKGRQAIAEVKEARENAKYALLQEKPEMLAAQLKEAPVLANAKIRSLVTTVSLLDEFDDEEMAEAVAEGALRLDMQGLAEALNLHASVANRVRKSKPDLAMSMLESFSYSLDIQELGDAAQWLMRDVAVSFKPLIRSVFPHVVEGICECLAPDNDAEQEGVERALGALRELLNPKEAD